MATEQLQVQAEAAGSASAVERGVRRAKDKRPMYLEFDEPVGRPRMYCCYKDDPCPVHAAAFGILVAAIMEAPGDHKQKLEALRGCASNAE